MHFPAHWAKVTVDAVDDAGKKLAVACWRWSDTSVAEAQEAASAAAAALLEKFKREGVHRGHYYTDRPLREPVLREVAGSDGEVAAAVTRNGYGCEVLNTARAVFIDVDLPEHDGPSLFGKLRVLLGGTAPELPALAKARRWVAAHPSWGLRVYRTRAGLRLLATHAPIDPGMAEVSAAFEAVGADPLYVKLCQTQQCYRARLTPKPWRIGVDHPKQRWPFEDAAAQADFERWQREYAQAARQYATCSLLTTLGNSKVHEEIAKVVRLHDEATRVGSNLPLA